MSSSTPVGSTVYSRSTPGHAPRYAAVAGCPWSFVGATSAAPTGCRLTDAFPTSTDTPPGVACSGLNRAVHELDDERREPEFVSSATTVVSIGCQEPWSSVKNVGAAYRSTSRVPSDRSKTRRSGAPSETASVRVTGVRAAAGPGASSARAPVIADSAPEGDCGTGTAGLSDCNVGTGRSVPSHGVTPDPAAFRDEAAPSVGDAPSAGTTAATKPRSVATATASPTRA